MSFHVLVGTLLRGLRPAAACTQVVCAAEQETHPLSPFGVAGRSNWLVPRRECTFVKSINIGDVKDHAPHQDRRRSGLGNEVEIAPHRSKTGK